MRGGSEVVEGMGGGVMGVEEVPAYPCGCPEVCDITEDMLDEAVRKALLRIMAVKLRRRVEELR